MSLTPYKKRKLQYAAILGAVAGAALFALFFYLANNWAYLAFIPLTMAMGCGYSYVSPDPEDGN